MQIWAAELSAKLIILLVLVAHACDMDAALAWKSTFCSRILLSQPEDKLTPFGLNIFDVQAKSEAAKQGKWLLVNLQSTTEFASYMVRM
jgi:hypothetical protein